MRLLGNLLRSFVRRGTLKILDASGVEHEFGDGSDVARVTLRLHNRAVARRLFFNPELVAAEAYMDGTLTCEDGSTIHDLLFLFSINRAALGAHPVQGSLRRIWRARRRRQQQNSVERAKHQAQHHYDLSEDLYRLFLDEGMNYSCAFFHSPDDSLEDAQKAKLARIVRKLAIEPGMTVCEIGGGWGSLAIELARAGADVVSLNVSPDQMAVAQQRVDAAGVTANVRFVLQDYREFSGQFDRVVSVGMMEHVGIGHFDEYFGQVRDLLVPDGLALVHSVGRKSQPGTTGPFIRKYIFPGGYVPALSEVFEVTERLGLWVADMEVLRLHYYHTIRHWRERFAANRDAARTLYDERFCRMWEFYLSAVELGFLNGSNMVFQLMISRERDAVPVVRDYMFDRPDITD
ncbi:MAG: class I SAM-dependent methyltransferase [Rhodospirillaceae bacterium]|nr:class I SAM-dependent methyltransferase [Rhodospirillaceae bacterium]MBT3807966.1 class I SAM-dependent methyltransferase [Rhodospirillaceae bacterium]MBT3929411.1 class I SAM-dependent methyltransferase [Rhodospirillaceae bacterium]MBT4771409.1 class I SAM-dependent methyltransferase [Rhodospirillaceae bacterium]MBT5356707.1 class I SAM-dependent methyltransferase [Rhodospirillaceae bacterium]